MFFASLDSADVRLDICLGKGEVPRVEVLP